MIHPSVATLNAFANTNFDEVLPGPFGAAPGSELEVQPEVISLVRSQVRPSSTDGGLRRTVIQRIQKRGSVHG